MHNDNSNLSVLAMRYQAFCLTVWHYTNTKDTLTSLF